MHLKEISIRPEDFPVNDCYPFNLELFHRTKSIPLNTNVTFFVGENGAGKSTLMKAIAKKCGINIWQDNEGRHVVKNLYEEQFYRYMDVEWLDSRVPGSFFSSETFRDFTRFLDDWAVADPAILECYGGKSLLTQSHGQSMMQYFQARYKIKGLYLLDEPETALSPSRLLELLEIIREMSRDGHAQFIIATHSPMLITCPGSEVFCFNGKRVERKDYRLTDLFRLYQKFFTNEYQITQE